MRCNAMQRTYLDCIVWLHAPCDCGAPCDYRSIWFVPTLILLHYLLLHMSSLDKCHWLNTLTSAMRFGTVTVALSVSNAIYQ